MSDHIRRVLKSGYGFLPYRKETKLLRPMDDWEEGDGYLNISWSREAKWISKVLHPWYRTQFQTIIGKKLSMDQLLAELIVYGEYPRDWLMSNYGASSGKFPIETYMVRRAFQERKLRPAHIPNWEAVVLEAIYTRLTTLPKKIRNRIRDHFLSFNGIYTSFREEEVEVSSRLITDASSFRTRRYVNEMGPYLKLLTEVRSIIRAGDGNPVEEELALYDRVQALKARPDVHVYQGIWALKDQIGEIEPDRDTMERYLVEKYSKMEETAEDAETSSEEEPSTVEEMVEKIEEQLDQDQVSEEIHEETSISEDSSLDDGDEISNEETPSQDDLLNDDRFIPIRSVSI